MRVFEPPIPYFNNGSTVKFIPATTTELESLAIQYNEIFSDDYKATIFTRLIQ